MHPANGALGIQFKRIQFLTIKHQQRKDLYITLIFLITNSLRTPTFPKANFEKKQRLECVIVKVTVLFMASY